MNSQSNSLLQQSQSLLLPVEHPRLLLPATKPYYSTNFGSTYLGNSLDILRALPDGCINTVITSPPYALQFKKEYGNVSKVDYVEWFLTFAAEIFRILSDDGSFILNIGGSYNPGTPTRSLYHYKLLIALVETIGFHLAQECFWYNPAKMPVPAEWVTVRRIRLRDSVEYVWWLSKTAWPKASNRSVLREYSKDMKRLNGKGLNSTTRPSGHTITPGFSKVEAGGSIPPNVIEQDVAEELLRFGNNAANDSYALRCKEAGLKMHPARFPAALPEFFVKLLTKENDVILDPFAGSNTTGAVAERLHRRWIAAEMIESYLATSKFRFV